jgi:hypothetical protein
MTKQTILKGPDALVGEKSQALHVLWKNLAGDRLAPKREEITLSLVKNLIPWLWTADVVDNGADFRFRLVGDRLIQFFGKRFSGMLLSEFPDSIFFERVKQIFTYCVEHKQPTAIGPVRSSYENKDHWETEAIALPLSDDGENVTGLIGVFELWPIGTNSTVCSTSAAISSV